ncbi:hypothetical protein CSA56_15595 [candidate division KSB3 bacterium]|uniref:TldD/PmbA family protein n=1 Tax=candidate division KSB3 bacterium TaxID=2044937 RepID=A0A2G6K9U4_9BACT|nr:MAG: hypothetical protein CSA56_15595 [candidate division KSB3 bacterium]
MIEKQNIQQIIRKVLDFSTADETEVILDFQTEALTRFANNAIHQNVAEESHSLQIRAIIGHKTGTATTNLFDDESLKRAAGTAVSIAQLQQDDPELLPLPEHQNYAELSEPYIQETLDFSPMERAERVRRIVEACDNQGLSAAGAFSTGGGTFAIANSKGVFACQSSSNAALSLTVQASDSSGWVEGVDKDVREIDVPGLTDIAIEKAVASQNPIDAEPGEYTVILEPAAVSTLIEFMSVLGFNAQRYQEGRSFLTGKLGTQIVGNNITLTDNAFDPRLNGFAFDFEGMPKQAVTLIEQGVASHLVHSRKTGQKADMQTTGHALPLSSGGGALPFHLILQGGNSSIEEMIASTDKGIYVTHFHYTNVVNPMEAIITGMTRDGTFLIENGKIAHGIKNLRFTESIVKALSHVELLSPTQTKCCGRALGCMLVPAMKISNFTFSSGTKF